METRNAWVWGIIVIIVIALGGWYVLAHQNITSTIPTDSSAVAATTQGATTTADQPTSTNTPALDPAAVTQSVVGSWQSTDDANYTVKITAGGQWTDSYKGADASNSTSETGTYTIFTSQNPDKDFTGILQPGVVYVKVAEGSSTLYFSVLQANGNELQMSYLDRGNTLTFVRTQ